VIGGHKVDALGAVDGFVGLEVGDAGAGVAAEAEVVFDAGIG
jgi:hypothetical protein